MALTKRRFTPKENSDGPNRSDIRNPFLVESGKKSRFGYNRNAPPQVEPARDNGLEAFYSELCSLAGIQVGGKKAAKGT